MRIHEDHFPNPGRVVETTVDGGESRAAKGRRVADRWFRTFQYLGCPRPNMPKRWPGPKGSADSRLRPAALHSETCHPSTLIGPASSSRRPGHRAPLRPGLPRLDWPRRQRPPAPPAAPPCPPLSSGPGARNARCTAAAAIASAATPSPTSMWTIRVSRGSTACCASRAPDGCLRTSAAPTGRSSGCSGSSGSRSPPTAWCGWATPMTGRSCAACPRPPPHQSPPHQSPPHGPPPHGPPPHPPPRPARRSRSSVGPIRSCPQPRRPSTPPPGPLPLRPARPRPRKPRPRRPRPRKPRPRRPAGTERPAGPRGTPPPRAVPRDPDPAGPAAPARRSPVARGPPPPRSA